MTPYEISVVVGGYAEQQKEAQRLAIVQAWTTAMLYRAKKPPKLEKLLRDIDAPRPQKRRETDEELAAAAKAKGLKGPWS